MNYQIGSKVTIEVDLKELFPVLAESNVVRTSGTVLDIRKDTVLVKVPELHVPNSSLVVMGKMVVPKKAIKALEAW